MPAPDPFADLPRLERLRLRWRLRAAWRAGRAERRRTLLARIHAELRGGLVTAVDLPADGGRAGGVAELHFLSGPALRLGPCHTGAVRRLAAAARDGARLTRASDHGRCWGLYFSTAGEMLPLLSGEVAVVPEGPGRAAAPGPDRLVPSLA